MLDHKTKTFLTLCEQRSYRKTAKILNITQPTVTQHIQALQKEYGYDLFLYEHHTLIQTKQAKIIENHLRKMKYDEEWLMTELKNSENPPFKLGATKTIGHFMIADKVSKLISETKYSVTMIIDNTQKLLSMLGNSELDVAVIEGDFDKTMFDSVLMQEEDFVGICHKDSPYANREVEFDEIKGERILIREEGSGTRHIFENHLAVNGESISSFKSYATISSFTVIKDIIAKHQGITFAYRSVLSDHPELATFSIKGYPSSHPLHYVFLPTAHSRELFDVFVNL